MIGAGAVIVNTIGARDIVWNILVVIGITTVFGSSFAEQFCY